MRRGLGPDDRSFISDTGDPAARAPDGRDAAEIVRTAVTLYANF